MLISEAVLLARRWGTAKRFKVFGFGRFSKSVQEKKKKKKLKPFDKYNKRLYNIIRLQEYDKVLFMYYTVGKVRALTDFQASMSKKNRAGHMSGLISESKSMVRPARKRDGLI